MGSSAGADPRKGMANGSGSTTEIYGFWLDEKTGAEVSTFPDEWEALMFRYSHWVSLLTQPAQTGLSSPHFSSKQLSKTARTPSHTFNFRRLHSRQPRLDFVCVRLVFTGFWTSEVDMTAPVSPER